MTSVPLGSIDGGSTCQECKGKCCKNCHASFGYFDRNMFMVDRQRFKDEEWELLENMRIDGLHTRKGQENFKQFVALLGVTFDEKVGFQGPTGCRIPREKRSWICLNYFCDELRKAVNLPSGTYWGQLPNSVSIDQIPSVRRKFELRDELRKQLLSQLQAA